MPEPTSIPLTVSIFCYGGDDALFAALAAASPGATVQPIDENRLTELMREPGTQGTFVLCDAPPTLLAEVQTAQAETGLPRWPVLLVSRQEVADAVHSDVIPRSQWTASVLARALRSTVTEHHLRRENAQLRGDLLTYGSRVAHDLRTPLGGILTTTEMLREILTDDAPSHVPLTQPLIDSADGLAALIERTSFFAKAVSATPVAETFDMGAAFWNAFQRLEGQILKAGASLKHPNDWPRVRGQQSWTEAVWRNLLQNALQHGGSQVKIEAGWTREPTALRFWVWDSGRVPDPKRATLFHPFHLLHHPGAPRGFGLAMVQRLVERQGGRCGYEAAATGGSRFYFTLPEAEPNASPSSGRG